MALSERDGLPFASVGFGGAVREVCLACQPDVVPGDFVLVHVGLAIAKIDRAQAERAWRVLKEIGQTSEVEPEAAADAPPFEAAARRSEPSL